MMNLLSIFQIIFIILIILVVLTQSVSVKILKDEDFLLEFHFTLFAFSVIPGKNEKKKRKKKKKNALVERLHTYSLVLKVLKLGLSHSHLRVRALQLGNPQGKETVFFKKALLDIPKSTLLAYLESISASFEYDPPKNSERAAIDAVIYIPLYHLIVTLAYYFKERLKFKYKARASS